METKTSSSFLTDPFPMASSSSSSTTIASSTADACRYDVFLSFRGEDTRLNFTDHLYERLTNLGFLTFRDKEGINRGEEITPEIKKAIKGSEASIVVLSENYATSASCLDELVLILQRRKDYGHFVLPVFYKVEPADVRNQINTYAIQVKEGSLKWTIQNVNLWKKALTEVSNLSGEVQSGSKYETEVLKEIVDVIYRKVCRKEVLLPSNLTGMTSLDEEVVSWLDGSGVEHLAICGMPGSGKTTLAKYLYNSKWKLFESVSFVEGIGHTCEESNAMPHLQQQLLNDILGGKNRKIPGVSQGTCEIEEALQRKKALIVLDDIVEKDQLVALLGTKMINSQSKIIITTTVLNIEEWLDESRSSRFRKYKMRLLNSDESLELLCRHAFKSKFPKDGFKELAVKAVHYCEGNPLALEVLGSSLMNNSIKNWKSILTEWDREVDSNIQRVLTECYSALPRDLHRELFLHIACFFVGKDKDYVEQILDDDCCATSGIQILCSRCLLFVSSRNKLMMNRLLQDMGKQIVRQESPKNPAKRSRVWRSSESYNILSNREGSKKVEGLALDMEMLRKEKFSVEPSNLKTDALQKMKKLKLLHLNSVYLDGSYKNVSEDLRWICWVGFQNESIPLDLFVKNLVAIDMSPSKLVVFDPPMVLEFLKILNLQDSHNLTKIHHMSRIPNLETLVLWNYYSLVHVCELGHLKSIELLHMTGCENMWRVQTNLLVGQEASSSGGVVAEQPTFSFPHSLQKLFLKDCNLDRTVSFPLSFTDQQSLQYLNLGNGRFDSLPPYDHLFELRVLDLSLSSRLKYLRGLPNTLVELYVYYCTSLERITFRSPKFTLLEFGYEGCTSLTEIEGFIKLVPVTKLEENDLAHMNWLRKYQDQEVCLVGNDELTKGRSSFIQILYEFGIMSTSLQDIKDPNMIPKYESESSSLSFDVPSCPENRRIKGLDVTFKYTLSGDDDWAWFCKINTTNGVDLMYNPIVFGKPDSGNVGRWLSYWPLGDTLSTGDKVNLSIIAMSGVEVHECGVSIVYADDKVAKEALENNMGWIEILGGDLSGFKLSTGAYYLCRRDFFKLLEVGRLTPDQFRLLVGDAFDITEVRGWRKIGQPKQTNPSFTELKTVRCIIHGPELEEIYKIPKMSKSSFVDKVWNSTSNMPEEKMKLVTSSKFSDTISIASGSSSSIMASPGVNASSYDVFLSFIGENTRDSFTDHLYDALMRVGIRTFKGNEEIDTSEQLNPETESAITESRASVVVLSDTYATSTRCLDELVLILKQQRECNHFILPIYYQVGPSDVRNQENTFSMEVKASSRWTDHNVNLWKKALTEVADLEGMLSFWPEIEFLKEVVDTIKIHLPINSIGMASRYKDIHSWFNRSNLFLVIFGMGGSGKTTLAKYIYNLNESFFENTSFIEDISVRCKGYGDLQKLRDQFLKDTLKIEEALQTKRMLIVLDDITDLSQLVTLLGTRTTEKINTQSKIMITTRSQNLKEWLELRYGECEKYEMRLLNDDESFELLSRHAFKSKIPMETFTDLAPQAIRYSEGNPLALELLGSSLSADLLKQNENLDWKSRWNLLKMRIHYMIQPVLIRDFNSLPHDYKNLFLHIACFYVGEDKDYVKKILQDDYSESGINILCNIGLLSVLPTKKLIMHRLLQEIGRSLMVRQEAPKDRKRLSSKSMEGLALDMEGVKAKKFLLKSSNIKTDALRKMDKLKLDQDNFVQLTASYKHISQDLRWLGWLGFHLRTIVPLDLFIGHLVALDMSYSSLEVFELPTVLQSLEILNLEGSHSLLEIHNLSMIPHLKTLILRNCDSLRVCETVGDLMNLELLDMTGCKNLFKKEQTNLLAGLEAFTYGTGVVKQPSFTFPHSLVRLFLNDCNLGCNDSLPLSFSAQLSLKYLNLGNSLFEFLPPYNHLKNLRVLDLSLCSRLKCLLCLPSTLEELFVHHCKSLKIITFESPRFTLHEFGYEGCVSLSEIEGFLKLVPIVKLEENDLGHMKWLKEYQNHEVCLVGNDELTRGRSSCVQMLYEFGIMSTSMPAITDPNMKPEYVSDLSSLSFDVPPFPKNKRLKGLDVTVKYTTSVDHDWALFCKISTENGVDLIYNPKVVGKPESGKVGIWLSYWPIGDTLDTGDHVSVSIVVMGGLEVHECGANLVYVDDQVATETSENNKGWVEVLGGDLSGFKLSTGAYYLCRHDFFELMEVGRLTTDWFKMLVGDRIDVTEIRGWRKNGRPKQLNPSFTELKTARCIIIYGHESELNENQNIESMEMSKAFVSDEIKKSNSSSPRQNLGWLSNYGVSGRMKQILPGVDLGSQTQQKDTRPSSVLQGVQSIVFDTKDGRLTVIGDVDPVDVSYRVRKIADIYILSVEPALEGIQSIVFDATDGTLTVVGDVDAVDVFYRVRKRKSVYIISVESEKEPTKET